MRQNELEKRYLELKSAYYQGKPLVSDAEFDKLEDHLKELGSSVVNMVGTQTANGVAYHHPSSMKSLSKVKFYDERFEREMEIFLSRGSTSVTCSPKYDGNAVNAIYNKGELLHVLRRGDGEKGEAVTDALQWAIPETLNTNADKIEVRGEVLIRLDEFEKKWSKEFKNPRNFVAGVLSNDESEEATLKSLWFIPLEVRIHNGNDWEFLTGNDLTTFWEDNPSWVRLGFDFREWQFTITNPTSDNIRKEVGQIISAKEEGSGFPFLLDGAVVAFNGDKERKEIGESSHSPKWAKAIKFQEESATSTITSIEWEVGTTGEVCPVAVLEPVELAGTSVSRVSMYNMGWLKENRTFPGARVEIIKSGDIIPKIVEVLSFSDDETIPATCPVCEEHLTQDGVHLLCTNPNCPGKIKKVLQAGFKALGFYHMGPAVCESLADIGFHSVEDWIRSKDESKAKMLRSGQWKEGRQLERVMENFKRLNGLPLEKLVLAMAESGTGKTIAKKIAQTLAGLSPDWSGIDKTVRAKYESLEEDAAGEFQRIRNFVKELEDQGYQIQWPKLEKEVKEDSLTFEMTGSPSTFGWKTKKEFLAEVEPLGGIHTKLKDAKILVTDDTSSNSSKMKKARKTGKEIMTYQDLIDRLK